MSAPFVLLVVAVLVVYIGYLHLQLHISRRIITALQEATLAGHEPERKWNLKFVLTLFGLAVLLAGFLTVGMN